MSRAMVVIIWFVFIASLVSVLFIFLMVTPQYLGLSGLMFFYASIFGWLWGAILLLWKYVLRRNGRSRDWSFAFREAAFLALCGAILLFLSQMRVVFWYTLAPFGAMFAFTQYILIKKS